MSYSYRGEDFANLNRARENGCKAPLMPVGLAELLIILGLTLGSFALALIFRIMRDKSRDRHGSSGRSDEQL